jgi:AcrR family transcriptional regulator
VAARSPRVRNAEPPAKNARRTAPRPNGEQPDTRDRVIVAALDAIHEYGYRHASSNKIAEHAGVTWGVIQYYFGTRERLLLAVLAAAIDDIERRIDDLDGQLPGATFDQRFDAWETLVVESFGYDLFPGIVQIVLDLGRDPSVADDTVAELDRYGTTLKRLADLAAQLGGDTKLPEDVGDYIVWSSWSTALAGSMHAYLRNSQDPQTRDRLHNLRRATAALVTEGNARR